MANHKTNPHSCYMLVAFMLGFAAAFAVIFAAGKRKMFAGFVRNVAGLLAAFADALDAPRKPRKVQPVAADPTPIQSTESDITSALRNLGVSPKVARDTAAASITAAGPDAEFEAILKIAVKAASLRKVA